MTECDDATMCSYVILRADCVCTADVLRAHVLTQLARFKVPRDILFVTDLPRTALGKVQHFKLKQDQAATPTDGEHN